MFGGGWRTVVARDKVEDGTKLVEDVVTFGKATTIGKRDPSSFWGESEVKG